MTSRTESCRAARTCGKRPSYGRGILRKGDPEVAVWHSERALEYWITLTGLQRKPTPSPA